MSMKEVISKPQEKVQHPAHPQSMGSTFPGMKMSDTAETVEVVAPARNQARRTPSRPRTKKVAAAGGASSGTLLLSLAQQVGPHTILGYILTYSAPTVAVVAGSTMIMLKYQAEIWTERWKVHSHRKTLVKSLKRPHVSEEYKADVRKLLEDVDRTWANAQVERAKKSIS
jgi:hypothetical protein